MKKLFAIITMFVLGAGIAVAQDAGKKADPASISTKKQTTVTTNNCDMNNFCCMRAGRMTQIKDGQEVGMKADLALNNGAKVTTNGTLTDAKGNTVTLKEGEAIDMNGNICVMGVNPATVPPAEVK
ncbi:MAG TPA: DUF6799 domain-containing protein [Bacteroidia bacterium]|nr:DUF6799 domain-containing protein [Bacteroidia bacterium]